MNLDRDEALSLIKYAAYEELEINYHVSGHGVKFKISVDGISFFHQLFMEDDGFDGFFVATDDDMEHGFIGVFK